jgi:hypothetical protein
LRGEDVGLNCGHDYAAMLGGVVAAVDQFCRDHGQTIETLTDPEVESVIPRPPWAPAICPYNSYAIQVGK